MGNKLIAIRKENIPDENNLIIEINLNAEWKLFPDLPEYTYWAPQTHIIEKTSNKDNRIPLYAMNGLSREFSTVTITFLIGNNIIYQTLPSIIGESFIKFIKSGIPDEYNCVDFVHQLFNKWTGLHIFSQRSWNIHKVSSEQELEPGDVILMARDKEIKEESHFAFYFGYGQYISLWSRKPLIVSGLGDMQNYYRSKYFCRLTPK